MSAKPSSSAQIETDPCGKDRDILCQTKTALIDEVKMLDGIAEAAVTNRESQEVVRNSQVCCVLKAQETHTFYRHIDYYVAIDASSKTEHIEKNIGDLIKKSDDLSKAINEAVKCINGIKAKTVELKAKACDLDTQMKDSCNSQQLNILNNHFSSKCEVVKPNNISPQDCYGNFSEIASDIIGKTDETWSAADSAFNNAVSIAGIQTFSNVESLKELSKTVAASVKEFKKNVDENIKSSEGEVKKAQEELSKAVKEVTTKTMEEHKDTTKYEGTAFALEFVCQPDCDKEDDIATICEKVMITLCGDPNAPQTPPMKFKRYPWAEKNID